MKPAARAYKNILSLVVVLFATVFLFSCMGAQPGHETSISGTKEKQKPKIVIAELERQIHVLINKERRKQGLPVLAWDDALAGIAKKHSRDMAKRNYFSHYSPEGHDFFYRYKEEGYTCGVRVGNTIYQGAENIALNHLYNSYTTVNGVVASHDWNSQEKIAETTVDGWMKSPGHRKNILTPYFKSEGIGVFVSPDDKVYITQNFC
jgi:uncharacterized protein YkwD